MPTWFLEALLAHVPAALPTQLPPDADLKLIVSVAILTALAQLEAEFQAASAAVTEAFPLGAAAAKRARAPK